MSKASSAPGSPLSLLLCGLGLLAFSLAASAQLPMPFFDDFEGPLNFTIDPPQVGGPTPCGSCPAPCQLARGEIRSGYQSHIPPMGSNALVLDSIHRGPAVGSGSWSSGYPLATIQDPDVDWPSLLGSHMASAEVILNTTGYQQLTLEFDFNFIVSQDFQTQFTVEIDDGGGWRIPVAPLMNGPLGNTYIPVECVYCPGACPGCGGVYAPNEWIHETIDLSTFNPGPGFKIRFRFVVRHNYDGAGCATAPNAVLIDNVHCDGITMGLAVSAPFPPQQLVVAADDTGLDATPFSITSFQQSSTYDSITMMGTGTGDDAVDIADLHLYEDLDMSESLTMGDVLIDSMGGGFPMDEGTYEFMLPAPVMLASGASRFYIAVLDLAGTATALETFRINVFDVNQTAPPGGTVSGVPRLGNLMEVQLSDLTMQLGPQNPVSIGGTIGQIGAVMAQLEFTSVGSATEVTVISLDAVGSGNDLTGIDLVWVAKDVNGNGRYEVAEPVLGMGTYPVNDGTVDLMLTTPLDVDILGPSYALILYDFSLTAAAAGAPENYCMRINDVADIQSTAQSVTIMGLPITQCATVTDMCPRTMCGDCDNNGLVNIIDALVGAQDAASILSPPLAGAAFSNCNVTGAVEPAAGATVNILDALVIAQIAAGLMPAYMCC